MRLIDADYLKNLPFEKMIHTDWGDTAVPIEEIDNAPTISPTLSLDNISDEDIEKFKMIWQRATSKGLLVQNERPQGEWKATGQTMGLYYVYACNKCGIYNKGKTNFCPNCGAKMKGGAE